jgi:uncharacterized protein
MDFKIRHHEGTNQGEFYAEKGSDRLGSVIYQRPDDNNIVIKETHVDEKYRHQGVGHDLVHHAVNYAKDKNLHVDVECPFAKSCLDEKGGQKAA